MTPSFEGRDANSSNNVRDAGIDKLERTKLIIIFVDIVIERLPVASQALL
jgi:hypothetical protein